VARPSEPFPVSRFAIPRPRNGGTDLGMTPPRASAAAFQIGIGNLGALASSNVYRTQDKPHYYLGRKFFVSVATLFLPFPFPSPPSPVPWLTVLQNHTQTGSSSDSTSSDSSPPRRTPTCSSGPTLASSRNKRRDATCRSPRLFTSETGALLPFRGFHPDHIL
jgi:hypothetical protein